MEQMIEFDERSGNFVSSDSEANKKFLNKMKKKYDEKLAKGELISGGWDELAAIERQMILHEILMKIVFGDSD